MGNYTVRGKQTISSNRDDSMNEVIETMSRARITVNPYGETAYKTTNAIKEFIAEMPNK